MSDWKEWPPIPLGVIRALEAWISSPENFTSYDPKNPMTGEQALANLAFLSGMGHVMTKLKVTHKRQIAAMEKTNIPSHVQQD